MKKQIEKMVEKLKTTVWGKAIIVTFILLVIGFLSYIFYFKGLFAFKENEKRLLDGARHYYERNPLKLPKEGQVAEISLLSLYEGDWVTSLLIPGKSRVCSEDGFVRVINKNGAYTYFVSLNCGKYHSKMDSKAPEIILKGANPLVIHPGEEYQDPGVEKVVDNKDTIKVEEVLIDTSKLNVNKVGNYEVTYKVYDGTFNLGKVTREVVVADTLSGKIEKDKGENHIYKGTVNDNYVLFSGMLFRAVKVNENKETMLITDNNIANVLYTTGSTDYKDSNVYTWLNEYFYSKISANSQKYMVDNTWCYDMQGSLDTPNNCAQKVEAKVGLLSLNEYMQSLEGEKSYLLTLHDFLLLNLQDDSHVWATNPGESHLPEADTSGTLEGIHPVIILQKDICIIAGDGTKDNPYKLQDYYYGKENEELKTRLIGEYVNYSGYDFRISNISNDGKVELTSSGTLMNLTTKEPLTFAYQENTVPSTDINAEGNLFHYLDNEIINYISEKLITKNTYQIPIINREQTYKELEKKEITSYFSVPATYEIFSGVGDGTTAMIYWLSDQKDNQVAMINPANGLAFYLDKMTYPENGIKLKLTLKEGTKIASGKGTVQNPYIVK